MLSSITPLGQRGRGASWARTVAAFWTGALVAGTAVFGLAGWLGDAIGFSGLSSWVPISIVALAMMLDLARLKPLGPRRQVNEDWLPKYRDWVTGLGFGLQLGAGFTTIVPVWAVWALLIGAALTGNPTALIIGLAFATGRALPLIGARNVDRPERLATLMQRLARLDKPAMTALLCGYAVVLILGVLNAT